MEEGGGDSFKLFPSPHLLQNLHLPLPSTTTSTATTTPTLLLLLPLATFKTIFSRRKVDSFVANMQWLVDTFWPSVLSLFLFLIFFHRFIFFSVFDHKKAVTWDRTLGRSNDLCLRSCCLTFEPFQLLSLLLFALVR